MKTLRLALLAFAVAGCAKTKVHHLAPGEPESDEVVVTYYYLKF
jgi:hypothetical protein